MSDDRQNDYCIYCGCDCFGNGFLCNRNGAARPCPVCGCGKKEQWLIDEEIKYNKLRHQNSDGEIKEEERREEEMLPKPQSNQGGGGSRSSGARRFSGVPFLKVENLTKEPKLCKILAVSTQKSGFNDLQLKVAMNGTTYFYGLKLTNPNFETLFNAFGEDENEWVGKEFHVFLQYNEFFEKQMMEVAIPEADGSKKKGRNK